MYRLLTLSLVLVALAAPALADAGEFTKYVEAVRKDAADHRAHLDDLYTTTLKVAGFLIVLMGGMIAALGWKTIRDVREDAQRVFKAETAKLLAAHEKELEEAMTQQRQEINAKFKDLSQYLMQAAQDPDTADEDDESLSPAPRPQGNKRHILWVDDFPENNAGPALVLREAGHTIDMVLDTETALTRLGKRHYDLVISDMGRGEDREAGLTLLERMKEKGLDVPAVIYASRGAINRTMQRAINLGAIETIGNGPSRLLHFLNDHFNARS